MTEIETSRNGSPWHARANEVRQQAQNIKDDVTRGLLIRMADLYEVMGQRVAEWERLGKSNS